MAHKLDQPCTIFVRTSLPLDHSFVKHAVSDAVSFRPACARTPRGDAAGAGAGYSINAPLKASRGRHGRSHATPVRAAWKVSHRCTKHFISSIQGRGQWKVTRPPVAGEGRGRRRQLRRHLQAHRPASLRTVPAAAWPQSRFLAGHIDPLYTFNSTRMDHPQLPTGAIKKKERACEERALQPDDKTARPARSGRDGL